jgi:hypothetical protein
MKKIAVATMLNVILVTAVLLILAPNKVTEKTVVDANVTDKSALQVSQSVPTHGQKGNSSQTQQQTSVEGLLQSQSSNCEKALPLFSPFTAAVFIVGLVAVFGLILSLCLRKRSKRKTSTSSHATAWQLNIEN